MRLKMDAANCAASFNLVVMSNMNFKYFRDPSNFTFLVDEPTECSVCGNVGIWFDSGGYAGVNDIDCICPDCMAN